MIAIANIYMLNFCWSVLYRDTNGDSNVNNPIAGKTNINGNNPKARTLDGKTSCTANAVGSRKTGSQTTSNNIAAVFIGLLVLLLFRDIASFQIVIERPSKNKLAVIGSNNVLSGILKRS